MRDVLGPGTSLGYCTNVHAGATIPRIAANLADVAARVRRIVCPAEPLGLGLWIPAGALDAPFSEFEELRRTMIEQELFAFTLNGFPYGNFHSDVVKHDVYRPDWAQRDRLEYTARLAVKIASLTAGAEASISTLPIGWKADFQKPARVEAAAHALRKLAVTLYDLEMRLGSFVHVDLEPEPGCYLETSEDVVSFFEKYLLHDKHAEHVRRYIRICHDVCHAAVMFEEQREVFARYEAAGIKVGKVQISSAVRIPFQSMDEPARRAAVEQLRRFDEPRYLHQTVVKKARRHAGTQARSGGDAEARRHAGTQARSGGDVEARSGVGTEGRTGFHVDLPEAMKTVSVDELPRDEWRVHFHVPVYLERFGALQTTSNEIDAAVQAALEQGVKHFEVETYAWGVLPDELKCGDLAAGIARELAWVRSRFGVGNG